MCALWLRKDHVSIDRRVRLYKAFVPLALLYNCCTWGATKACMSRLDAFHSRHLGIGEHSLALGSTPWHWGALLGIRYPARISNAALYKTYDGMQSIEHCTTCRTKLYVVKACSSVCNTRDGNKHFRTKFYYAGSTFQKQSFFHVS